ncbi:hypothetical protein RSOL_406350, partial [Rhizoctonia solani AG-3 Rhs1AP]
MAPSQQSTQKPRKSSNSNRGKAKAKARSSARTRSKTKTVTGPIPSLVAHLAEFENTGPSQFETAHLSPFKHEEQPVFDDPDRYDIFLRTANHFSFVKRGTLKMIKWDGKRKVAGGLDMIAHVSPLSGGVRKLSRSLAGYTPLYREESNPDVWKMSGVSVRVQVRGPLRREQQNIGGQPIDGVWVDDENEEYSYLLQHPDTSYKEFYRSTVTKWNQRVKATSTQLIHFNSVDLEKPCPKWMSLWAMRMLRLEHKLPRDVPGDEGSDEQDTPPTPGTPRLPAPDEHGTLAEDDDQRSNCSDAESLRDSDPANVLPNSTTWNWATKSSRPWDTVSQCYGTGASIANEEAMALAEQGRLMSPFCGSAPSPGSGIAPTPRFRTQSPESALQSNS